MLHTYSLDINTVKHLLYSHFIFLTVIDEIIILVSEDDYVLSQSLIDKHYYNVNDLTPLQFYYLLAKLGLDDAINTLLSELKLQDINKYSNYKAYLNGARFYEFSKTYQK